MNSETTIEKPITASKIMLCHALRKFINQRSGIDFRNYWTGDYWNARSEAREAFNGDYRPMLKHGRHARIMLRYVELSDISADQLVEATRAYSGRLQFHQTENCLVSIDYTTGQYFPTEYRKAACAVLAQAIWDPGRLSDVIARVSRPSSSTYESISQGVGVCNATLAHFTVSLMFFMGCVS